LSVLARIVAVLFVLIALFLLGAVINAAFFTDEGAKTGVAILYIVISVVLLGLAKFLWPNRATT